MAEIQFLGRTSDRVCNCDECQAALALLNRSEAEKAAANERAEGLLRRYLAPEQIADWEVHQALNVRCSHGLVVRLYPNRHYVDDGRTRFNIWPSGIAIPADWALAMLLHLEAAQETLFIGCTDRSYGPGKISDYNGAI